MTGGAGKPRPTRVWRGSGSGEGLARVWRAPREGLASDTSCGGTVSPPCDPQTTGPISEIQTPFDTFSYVFNFARELSKTGAKFGLKVTDDVTGQVKVRTFDFSGLVTSESKISMLSANKANESAWIVSLIFISTISCAL